jgi:hypothetical protein
MIKINKLDIKELKGAYEGNQRPAANVLNEDQPRTIDEYLAGVNADQRVALAKLRKIIRAVARWFAQVFGQFTDKHTPPHRMFQIHGTVGAPVAIAFDPDGAPFLVKNPSYGNKLGEVIESEVSWREGTPTRSAKRGEFLSMMYRQTLVPDAETFNYKVRRKGEGTLPHFEIEFLVLIICASPRPIVIALNRVSWRVGLSPDFQGAPGF